MAQKDVPLADQHVWNTRGGFSRMLNDGVEWCSSCGLLKLSSGAAGRLAGHGQPGFLRPIPHDQPTFYPIDNWPFGPPCTRVVDAERVRLHEHVSEARNERDAYLNNLEAIADALGVARTMDGWRDAVVDAAKKHPRADLLQVMVGLVAHRGAFHNEDETPTREQWAYGVCEDAKALIAAARSKT